MRTIIGLDGKTHAWNYHRIASKGAKRESRSKYHLRARDIIREIYPGHIVLEEVTLPGSRQRGKGYKLSLDFFIPMLDLAVEVHGQQHYHFIPFFHKDKRGFVQALNRDDDKAEWCEMNGVDLVILKYSDFEDDWKQQLKRRTNNS